MLALETLSVHHWIRQVQRCCTDQSFMGTEQKFWNVFLEENIWMVARCCEQLQSWRASPALSLCVNPVENVTFSQYHSVSLTPPQTREALRLHTSTLSTSSHWNKHPLRSGPSTLPNCWCLSSAIYPLGEFEWVLCFKYKMFPIGSHTVEPLGGGDSLEGVGHWDLKVL